MGCMNSKQFKRRPGYEDPKILASETSCKNILVLLSDLVHLILSVSFFFSVKKKSETQFTDFVIYNSFYE